MFKIGDKVICKKFEGTSSHWTGSAGSGSGSGSCGYGSYKYILKTETIYTICEYINSLNWIFAEINEKYSVYHFDANNFVIARKYKLERILNV
jgi:hypothetical protein